MRGVLIGALLGGALVAGYGILTKNNAALYANSGSQISSSPNSMIVNVTPAPSAYSRPPPPAR